MTNDIEPSEVHKKLTKKEEFLIVDVREPYEFMARHIPGAVNIPVSRFMLSMPKLSEKQIITVCEHGVRSERVRQMLAAKGHNVLSMRGGMSGWKWEVEKGNN